MWPFESKPYSLKIHGRAGMTYREGQNMLRIDSELLSGGAGMAVFWSRVGNWTAPTQAPLSLEEKARIKDRIATELKQMGVEWH